MNFGAAIGLSPARGLRKSSAGRSPPAVFNYDTRLTRSVFFNAPRGEKWRRTKHLELGVKEPASIQEFSHRIESRPRQKQGSLWVICPSERAANVRIHFLISSLLNCGSFRRTHYYTIFCRVPFRSCGDQHRSFYCRLSEKRRVKEEERRGGNRILALRLNGLHWSFPLPSGHSDAVGRIVA